MNWDTKIIVISWIMYLGSAERKLYADLLHKNKSNLIKIWCVLKGIVNKNKYKRAQEKFRLSDQSVISDRNIINTRFNDYFIDIGHNLASKKPDTGIQPKFYLKGTMVDSLFLEPVTENEIEKIVLSLKNGAPGYDDVTAQILKSCVLKVQQPLSYLCNRSLTEGIFPREMKIANVLPLYKSGDPMLFNNYRPVSLLCILSKVFEKVTYSRLLNFLNHYKVLISNQFGFRKSHSSYMALMVMINELTNALENGD